MEYIDSDFEINSCEKQKDLSNVNAHFIFVDCTMLQRRYFDLMLQQSTQNFYSKLALGAILKWRFKCDIQEWFCGIE